MQRRILLVCVFLAAIPAQAVDLQIHGFANMVGSESTTELPIGVVGNEGKRLTLDPESLLGLNFNADLGGNLSFASQVVGQGNDGANYILSVDWFFVTYKPFDGLAFRVGAQINPTFLLSEQTQVGYTYPWARLPYEVYGLDPDDAFFGASVLYTLFIGELQLRTQVYAGGGTFSAPAGPMQTVSGTLDDNRGIDISLSSDAFKFRIGYQASNPHLVVSSGGAIFPLDIGNGQIFSAGGRMQLHGIEVISEVASRESTGTTVHSGTGAYGTLGYHLTPRFAFFGTYAWLGSLNGTAYVFPDPTVSTSLKTDQHSYMLGVTGKVSSSVLLKAEVMRTLENFVDTTQDFGANTYTLSLNLVF